MRWIGRHWIGRLACGLGLLLAASAAFAQQGPGGYPNRPVKVIVPFAPGGPTDVMARLVAQKLSESLGQQFFVENHAGAGGNIGMLMGAKTAPDGYTLVFVSSSFVVNPSLYAKKPYDAFKDFAPVTLAAASPNILVVHPSVEAKTVKELIELIKANPSKYGVANPGIGTTPHLAAELFKLTFKLDVPSVPFNGAGPAITSTVGGHTPIRDHAGRAAAGWRAAGTGQVPVRADRQGDGPARREGEMRDARLRSGRQHAGRVQGVYQEGSRQVGRGDP